MTVLSDHHRPFPSPAARPLLTPVNPVRPARPGTRTASAHAGPARPSGALRVTAPGGSATSATRLAPAATADPARAASAARRALHGRHRAEIGQQAELARLHLNYLESGAEARVAGQTAHAASGRVEFARAHGAELLRILVHLRECGENVYDADAHATRVKVKDARWGAPDARTTARVLATGHPVGSRVQVFGTEETGVVRHVEVAHDEDGFLAVWYVVRPDGRPCLAAFGGDELEPLG